MRPDDAGRADVREAVLAAAHAMADAGPGALVFLEDRLEGRVEGRGRGTPQPFAIRLTGAALHGATTIHVSDPPLNLLRQGPGATRKLLNPAADQSDRISCTLPAPELPLDPWVDWASENGRWDVLIRLVAFHQNIWVARAQGGLRTDTRRGIRLQVSSLSDPGASRDLVLDGTAGDPSSVIAEVVERVRERRGATPIDLLTDGPPLVLGPGTAGVVVHELVGHALEGDDSERGGPIAASEGPVGPSFLRVIDDPGRGRAPWLFDDEGFAARPVTLIEAGRVTGRLLDGHLRRSSFLEPALPRMGCTYIDRGEDDPAEIVAGTGRGIFVHRLVGGHTHPRTGRASFVVMDAERIERGRRTRPLRPFLLELEAREAIGSIDRIGADLEFDTVVGSCVRAGQPLAVSVGAPTVRLGVVTAMY